MRLTCVERTAAGDLQSSGGRRVIRSGKEIFNTRHRWMWLKTWIVNWYSGRCSRCACMSVCVFVCDPGQLGGLFCVHLVFPVNVWCIISTWTIPVMLKLFPNISIMLEQIHIFKISIVAKLIILYSHLNICHYIYFFSQFWVLMPQKKCPPPTWNLFFQRCFHG